MARGFILSTIALSAVGAFAKPDVCCERLTAALSTNKVFKASTPTYGAENQKYWSPTCILNPGCIFVPESASDVANAVKILTKNKCEFAVRGGGHTANPGWAGTNSGVLISLSKLTTIEVSGDKASVVVGAGNRWGDVYAKTGEHNVTVTGGRITSVGVSGFLLGGGLSFLMHEEGFAANNVLSYEIVLANGTVATVTNESAGDLFKALKGGTGNFGIATSFKLRTFPVNKVYAGYIYYTPDQFDTLFPIMEAYARTGVESDPKTHVISTFGLFPSQGIDMGGSYAFYSEPVTAPPPAIKPFFDISTVQNTASIKTVKEAADELGAGGPEGVREDMRTFSIQPSAGLYKQLVDLWRSTALELNGTSGFYAAMAFQVISRSMIDASNAKGGNVLGLKPQSTPFIVVNYQFGWAQAEDDGKVYAASDRLMAAATGVARSQGKLERYLYLNYAGSEQKPIEAYGPAQVDFLRKVKAKYDPNRVFEKLSRGGYKIPS